MYVEVDFPIVVLNSSSGNDADWVILLTSRTLPYGAGAFLRTPLSSTVAFPWVLVVGFAQLMVLGFDAWTRVNTFSVGSPASGPLVAGLPLNSSTQPLMVNAPLAVAVAVPVPTSAPAQFAIACFIVWPESWLSAHLDAALVLIFQFLSR